MEGKVILKNLAKITENGVLNLLRQCVISDLDSNGLNCLSMKLDL